jgi:hypothetical protein
MFTLPTRIGLDGYGEARVYIDKKYAKVLLKRVELLREVRVKDDSAIELYFFDCNPNYYEGDAQLVTNADQMIARRNCVMWCAYPDHSDVEMKTEEVSVDDLKKIANG